MSAFSDLWRRFPAKMFDICLEECYAEMRSVYEFEIDELRHPEMLCVFCERKCVYECAGYDGWEQHFNSPLPAKRHREQTCGSVICVDLFGWFYAKRTGRRQKFVVFYGKDIVDVDRAVRIDAVLAFKLRETAKENDAGKKKLRMAA